MAYKLQLPFTSKIHDVFHVSLLKKSVGNHVVSGTLSSISDKGDYQAQPLLILDKWMIQRQGRVGCEVLVQWDGIGAENSTWIDVEELQAMFPEFDVWGNYHS